MKATNSKNQYQDSSEETLLRIFSKEKPEREISKILAKNTPWPLEYHLSKQRENLLNWYPFKKDQSLLEIGAGCGALTGLFCRNLERVLALELTEERAEVISRRYSQADNLEVVHKNFFDFESDEKFDLVSSIGVLEYVGVYSDQKKPYTDFLKKIKSFLKKDGQLVLAIENKLGLKYWAGSREDHTGIFFDSILNYSSQSKIRTFSLTELKELLDEAGLKVQSLFFPSPDYKLPIEIFSEGFLPGGSKFFNQGTFPARNYGQPRVFLFSESLAVRTIIESNIFKEFANSYLIFAKSK